MFCPCQCKRALSTPAPAQQPPLPLPLPQHLLWPWPPSATPAAAIDQLVTLGGKIEVPVFELGTQVAPPEIAR